MSEIRKDYISDKWIVIAAERAKRPDQWKEKSTNGKVKRNCPFCYGNEHMTPPEVLAYRPKDTQPDSPGWKVRCIPNKFPVLRREGISDLKLDPLFNHINGVGAHEVVIETPEHEKTIAALTHDEVCNVIKAYQERYIELCKDEKIKYTLIFRNNGLEAGASIEHPHSQIIATPIIPKRIVEETQNAKHYYESSGEKCIYDEIIANELKQKVRVIVTNSEFVAICPYASSFPFEVWIIPRRHNPSFGAISVGERPSLAKMLKFVLGRIFKILDDPPYNYIVHTAPCDGKGYESYHWHIEIIPRLTRIAGFEWGTGFYINPLPPEDAAKFLRIKLSN